MIELLVKAIGIPFPLGALVFWNLDLLVVGVSALVMAGCLYLLRHELAVYRRNHDASFALDTVLHRHRIGHDR